MHLQSDKDEEESSLSSFSDAEAFDRLRQHKGYDSDEPSVSIDFSTPFYMSFQKVLILRFLHFSLIGLLIVLVSLREFFATKFYVEWIRGHNVDIGLFAADLVVNAGLYSMRIKRKNQRLAASLVIGYWVLEIGYLPALSTFAPTFFSISCLHLNHKT